VKNRDIIIANIFKESKLILTTMVTSLQLTELQLRGCFTHVFIDEAAQVYYATALLCFTRFPYNL